MTERILEVAKNMLKNNTRFWYIEDDGKKITIITEKDEKIIRKHQ